MSELKPCPFCGASSCLDRDVSGWNKIKANHSDNCPLLGNNLLTWSSGETVPIIDKWNTRASDTTITEQEKVIGELVELLDYFHKLPIDLSKSWCGEVLPNQFRASKLIEELAKHKQSKGE